MAQMASLLVVATVFVALWTLNIYILQSERGGGAQGRIQGWGIQGWGIQGTFPPPLQAQQLPSCTSYLHFVQKIQ